MRIRSDNQPLVVVLAKSKNRRARIERELTALAWDPQFRGRFAFARTEDVDDLRSIEDAPESDTVLVVQPDVYGLEGSVIAATQTFSKSGLTRLLTLGLADYEVLDKSRRQNRAAQREGIQWTEDTTERAADPANSRRARRRRSEN